MHWWPFLNDYVYEDEGILNDMVVRKLNLMNEQLIYNDNDACALITNIYEIYYDV